MEEASGYMDLIEKTSRRFAPTVSACILSPIVLLLLLGLSRDPNPVVSEGLALVVGISVLLIMATGAVASFIINGLPLSKYEYLDKEVFELEYGISGLVQGKKAKYESTFIKGITIGVMLCILSGIPLIVVSILQYSQLVILVCLDILLVIVSMAVFLFVRVGMVHGSYEKLLQTGDFTREIKTANKKIGQVGGVYWSIVTALYLLLSFLTMKWGRTWIIWPCAGVLFGAVAVFLHQREQAK